jgi:hypothetical protein
MAEALRFVTGELGDFVHLPELPERGAAAGMVGRSVALLSGLAADLQPAGWRLTDAPGADHRRAVSRMAQDLDLLEEHTQGYEGRSRCRSPARGRSRPRWSGRAATGRLRTPGFVTSWRSRWRRASPSTSPTCRAASPAPGWSSRWTNLGCRRCSTVGCRPRAASTATGR